MAGVGLSDPLHRIVLLYPDMFCFYLDIDDMVHSENKTPRKITRSLVGEIFNEGFYVLRILTY